MKENVRDSDGESLDGLDKEFGFLWPPWRNYRYRYSWSGKPRKQPHEIQHNKAADHESVGTLCDDPHGLTCSFYVAKKWAGTKTISPYPTFEDAILGLKEGKVKSVLIPAAYPLINTFIMDYKLRVCEVFLSIIPALVLVAIDGNMPKEAEVIYYHPATAPLLAEINVPYWKAVPVTSNPKACEKLLLYGGKAIAITNALCLEFYRLINLKTLRDGIVMPFMCFVRSEAA